MGREVVELVSNDESNERVHVSPKIATEEEDYENKKHFESRVTHGTAPRFRSAQRAEKRREYYRKLEEKHQALEAERNMLEQRQKEEQEAAIKHLRKNLKFKANPVPDFYYQGPPVKPELKKFPLTRPKSPKLNQSRRLSCSDAISSSGDENSKSVSSQNRHSIGSIRLKPSLKKNELSLT